MRSGKLARSRAATACVWAALSLGLAGCAAATSSTVSVTGTTLTIYSSLPLQTGGQDAQDVLSAEQLALRQSSAQGQVGKFKVVLKSLSGSTSAQISTNARTAIEDTSTIAYLGELTAHSSYASLGITNAQDVLQVSPTDNALELTQPTPAVPNSPTRYYEALKTYGRTFARVVPSGALEAKAQVMEMQALSVKKLYVAQDGSQYGDAIAYALRQDASTAGIAVVQGEASAAKFGASGADALFFGASSESAAAAARLFGAAATTNSGAKLFAPSALDVPAFASALGSGKLPLYVSMPGFLPADSTAQGKKFVADFTAAFGHAPASRAIFGFEAMSAVLSAIQQAGSAASDRSSVVHDFFAIKDRTSVLGTYSVNVNGDVAFSGPAPFILDRFTGGQLVPFKFLPVTG